MVLKSTLVAAAVAFALSPVVMAGPDSAEDWYEAGKSTVDKNMNTAAKARGESRRRARNIILFVGDGMGVSTVTAARIREGQLMGKDGEEHQLFFERFPHLALSKTYNTNQQTPDSAGTMTAMMTGVKTKAGVIGVSQTVTRADCNSQAGNELTTALELAEIAGMSTGVVTTARLTHATPAATYAHVVERNFEDDRDGSKVTNPGSGGCIDIAQQLIDFPSRFPQFSAVDGLEVAMGGGRRSFVPRDGNGDCVVADPEGGSCERTDGRDLTAEWVSNYSNAAYVHDTAGFNGINPATTDHLLGLFDPSHLEYETDRATDDGGEPSLSEMTEKAIDILSKNRRGFFLHVESGRIDHAHHATNPYRALDDTIEFAQAIKTAYEKTDPRNTLILVTADHSHVFTIAGYPTRGNDILGKVQENDGSGNPTGVVKLAADMLPYTTLGYTNGRGFMELPGEDTADAIYGQPINTAGRADLTGVDTTLEGFHSETLVPLGSETHAAEDVAIYASGPGSALVNGVMEQNAIYHVMNQAGRLEARAMQRGWTP